ncbi:VRR-NUC domain-containing protein [Gimibacter soli]|uniref:phosphodiesterase I n=1 Tax=Gimibacter soli TaxID=3024400 RepID=A0AAE9XNR5_9PROT|nr:VRR-NUC domain-containing protein [Gimibacter soli]WCL54402.1 VRR-NUC domain-containing protein [Gimibacter soli]
MEDRIVYGIGVLLVLIYLWRQTRRDHSRKSGEPRKEPRIHTPRVRVSTYVDTNTMDASYARREQALASFKKSHQFPKDTDQALQMAHMAMEYYATNHGQDLALVRSEAFDLGLSEDPVERDKVLRKAIATYYKDRDDPFAKTVAVYLSLEHVILQLTNPLQGWKNFLGLQKLQTNWKAEEYFEALLGLQNAYVVTFPFSTMDIATKTKQDIGRTLELWHGRTAAHEHYETNKAYYEEATRAGQRYFAAVSVVDYLTRRYKFNPVGFRDELVMWCERGVSLIEPFLVEYNAQKAFDIYDPNRDRKIARMTLEKVQALPSYEVPRLSLYETLKGVLEGENDREGLARLHHLGARIRYEDGAEVAMAAPDVTESLSIDDITTMIEVKASGEKGKLAFLRKDGTPCSTEDAFADHMEADGWKVMRAEVSFWQAMFCLTFWDEIFTGMGTPQHGADIPIDLFRDETFYRAREQSIDQKFANLSSANLKVFINRQIGKTRGAWTRLLFDGDEDLLRYARSSIVQEFLEIFPAPLFAKIVYRIATNPNQNRAGLPDFIVWKEDTMKFVETKKVREQLREAQFEWLQWLSDENVPIEICRVKAA